MKEINKDLIYNNGFIKSLFNEMSKSYNLINNIFSFGFSARWRKENINNLLFEDDNVIYDLMTGMGESWEFIINKSKNNNKIIAVDFSEGMLSFAQQKKLQFNDNQIEIVQDNVLEPVNLKSNSADIVVSSFGLKTFSESQLNIFADNLKKILKNNGSFSFIEVSIPDNLFLKLFFSFYIKKIIPVIGKIFLGNPDNYRMLGIYTENFKNCKQFNKILTDKGFTVNYKRYFFGCATGVFGKKNL